MRILPVDLSIGCCCCGAALVGPPGIVCPPAATVAGPGSCARQGGVILKTRTIRIIKSEAGKGDLEIKTTS